MTTLLASNEVMEFLMAAIIMAILFAFMRGSIGGPDNSKRLERKLDALLKYHGIELPRVSLEVQRLAKEPTKMIVPSNSTAKITLDSASPRPRQK
jgi:hypothetical protein